MRGLEFDPESETEIVGARWSWRLRGEGYNREGAREEPRGERGLDGLDSPARRY